MARISTHPRYVTDITGPDPHSFGELGGGGGNSEKLKNEVFVIYGRVIRS